MKGPRKASNENLLKFNHTFKWNRIMLRILGIWPGKSEKISIIESFGTIVLIFILASSIVEAWLEIVIIWGDFDPMLDNLTANLPMSLALVKILIMRWYFKKLQYCFNEAFNDWQEEYSDEEMKVRKEIEGSINGLCFPSFFFHSPKVMSHRAKVGRIFSIAGLLFAVPTGAAYAISPLIITEPENSTAILTPFPLRSLQFFEPIPTTVYRLIYATQSIACFVSSIGYSASDCFFAALGLHACGQLEILGQVLRQVDEKNPNIRYIVERYLDLVKFVKELENIYTIIILGQLIISSLAICGIGYKCIMSLDDKDFLDIIKFSLFLIAMLIQIFLYCYTGQCLIDENNRLSNAAYECLWYKMNKSNAKAFLLIQLRIQKPLQITALKFCVMSHGCFANILRTSATYLSVLRAIK